MLTPVTPEFTQSAPFPSAIPLVVVKIAGTLAPPANLALKSSAFAPDARFPASEIVVRLFAEIDTGDVELREEITAELCDRSNEIAVRESERDDGF